MNYKHLSKYHYIYEFTFAENTARLQRFPIVYSNKDVIYYIRNGAERLEYVSTNITIIGFDESIKARLQNDIGKFYDDNGYDTKFKLRRFFILNKEEELALLTFVKNQSDITILKQFKLQAKRALLQKSLCDYTESKNKLELKISEMNSKISEIDQELKELGDDV